MQFLRDDQSWEKKLLTNREPRLSIKHSNVACLLKWSFWIAETGYQFSYGSRSETGSTAGQHRIRKCRLLLRIQAGNKGTLPQQASNSNLSNAHKKHSSYFLNRWQIIMYRSWSFLTGSGSSQHGDGCRTDSSSGRTQRKRQVDHLPSTLATIRPHIREGEWLIRELSLASPSPPGAPGELPKTV